MKRPYLPYWGRASILAFSCLILLSGCTLSPSLNVLGAYFPDWMFCIVAGVILTLIVRGILIHYQRESWLSPLMISWPTLTVLFSVLAWIMFFNH